MNKIILIGNATKDPELRVTSTGKQVCAFTLAVNRRKKVEGQPDADFFRVTAWEQKAELCAKYVSKGKKLCVIGSVSLHTYDGNDGKTRANLEVVADEVEFLSSRSDSSDGMTKVDVPTPFDNDVPY